jgi:DHA1 family multidrug resistance protein-like MFS transporter
MSGMEEKGVYRALFIVNFLVCLGFGISDPFFPVYATSNGAAGIHLALIFSGFAAAKTLFSPLTGWWSDRIGRRRLLVIGLFAHGAIAIGYLYLPSPPSLILLRFLQGVAAALVRPVSLAYVGDMAPARHEGTAMGTFDISYYAALAIGPVAGGIIKDTLGFPGIFFSLFILCLLAFAAALIFVGHFGKNREKDGRAFRVDLSLLKKSRTLIALCGFIFSRTFGIVYLGMFLPIFMHENLHLTGIEMGVVMGTNTIVTALLLRPMGRLSDRVRRDWLILFGGAAAALLTAVLPLSETFPHLLFLSIGIGFASVLSLPASSALLVEEGNRHGMGLTMGIFNAAMNLGAVLAPLAGGILFSLFGMKSVFYGAGLLGFAGIYFYFLARNTRARDSGAGS